MLSAQAASRPPIPSRGACPRSSTRSSCSAVSATVALCRRGFSDTPTTLPLAVQAVGHAAVVVRPTRAPTRALVWRHRNNRRRKDQRGHDDRERHTEPPKHRGPPLTAAVADLPAPDGLQRSKYRGNGGM